MKGRTHDSRNGRERSREALRKAVEGLEPRIDPLLDAVPTLLAEAERRRRAEARQSTVAALVPLASRAIPRLAAAAVVLVLIAAGLSVWKPATPVESAYSLERTILSGMTETDDDPLLEAILAEGNGNG